MSTFIELLNAYLQNSLEILLSMAVLCVYDRF